MATALTLENIERDHGIPVNVRKGSNAWHVMMAAPVMIGSYVVRAICGRNVGDSGDVEMTKTPGGDKFCKACVRIHRELLNAAPEAREDSAPEPAGQLIAFRIEGEPVTGPSEDERAELVKRERERRAQLHAARKRPTTQTTLDADESGTDTREDSGKIWGHTWEEIRAINAAFYATHPASPEVAALPDPHVTRSTWGGTNGAGDTDYRGCEGAGPVAIVNLERTHGKCSQCHAYIPLLDTKGDEDFRIGSHYEYGVKPPAIPASKKLVSRSIETVEHGSIPGSPMDANKRRMEESRCNRSGRVVRNSNGGEKVCTGCARKVELVPTLRKIKGELRKVWLYPKHVDARDTFRGHGSDAGYVKGERKVTPRGNGADVGATVEHKKVSSRLALSRGHGTVDGAANVSRQNMPPVQPRGWLGKAGTGELPATLQTGVDPEVSGKECPVCEELPQIAHRGKGKTWKRNHARRLRAYWEARDAAREAQREADIAAGRIMSTAARKAARKAASIGSFAEGTVAGTVVHDGTRPKSNRRNGKRKASALEQQILNVDENGKRK